MTRVAAPAAVSLIAVFAGNALDAHTSVQLGEALAVAAVIVPATIWIGRFMQKVIDSQTTMRKEIDLFGSRVSDLNSRIEGLACQHLGTPARPCPKQNEPWRESQGGSGKPLDKDEGTV